ncbi:MAG: hypothetical protein P8Y48_04420 [Novosphingobium sp.]
MVVKVSSMIAGEGTSMPGAKSCPRSTGVSAKLVPGLARRCLAGTGGLPEGVNPPVSPMLLFLSVGGQDHSAPVFSTNRAVSQALYEGGQWYQSTMAATMWRKSRGVSLLAGSMPFSASAREMGPCIVQGRGSVLGRISGAGIVCIHVTP